MAAKTALRLLLVEDSPQDVRLLQEAFREVGLAPRLQVARDAEEAWTLLREGGAKPATRPHAVLLDLNLPGASGHEVLQRIGQDASLRAVPVVVLTSSNHPSDVEQARHERASAYFLKPLTLAGYVALARDLQELLAPLTRANP